MSVAPPAGWDNFFVAEVGASAALIGLLFVAVSINLTRILAIQHLPGRAAESLLVLAGVLVVATFGLVPGQSQAAFGWEVMGTSTTLWGVTASNHLRAYRDAEARPWLARRVVWSQVVTWPFLIGGALLVSGKPSGMYWIVPGILASFGAGIENAWVLLVEILR